MVGLCSGLCTRSVLESSGSGETGSRRCDLMAHHVGFLFGRRLILSFRAVWTTSYLNHRSLSSPQAGTELPHETPHDHPIFTRTSSIHFPTCLTLLFTILSRVARTLFVFAFLSSSDICTTFFIASISVSPCS